LTEGKKRASRYRLERAEGEENDKNGGIMRGKIDHLLAGDLGKEDSN